MVKRGGWWLTGRTEPAAIAGACQSMCFLGFIISINLMDEKPASTIFLAIFMVMMILTPIGGWASVRALRRSPSLIREPRDPLSAGDARLWWRYGLVSLGLVLLKSVAQFWWRSGIVVAIQFFPFLLGMWSFRVLARQAGSTAGPAVALSGRHQDG